ncbi:class II fructose-bisphosphate aldolase [Robinsoniella peoriensis]|uniref:D-tagatose-1,6-bisphosphate aldolase subunit GatY n=1 Tax=Robinsoniella peoriensis TaxID=180332 RepID=A0A4U8QDS9_9FIRM|nr:class II fructose-bisphosphate aldolase [Robinsoniella peoriensis]MDU7031342.1 class II fructose-bisphosphate aldolase [Clostridiales bacterium]TLD00096.1 D-tagatose-1,6-bisphosphate aldolase subunit GatY [Robinsoniella peoriensis]
MEFASVKELLCKAQENGYAVPAFNVENMETVQGVIQAAEELNCPVILQTTPSSVNYAGLDFFTACVRNAIRNTRVPVALHLDHGSSYELAARAMKEGYSSVMIDGSRLNFEDNVALTSRVSELGKILGVSVEAELGSVGGKEDGLTSESVLLTNAAEAVEFAERTKVDSLAVAIGTAHGFYKGEPKLDIKRLKEIKAAVNIPLVLHGTSGVPDEIVKECIKNGICKVNYATDLRNVFTKAVKLNMEKNPDNIDPKKYLGAGREAVSEIVKKRIRLCY